MLLTATFPYRHPEGFVKSISVQRESLWHEDRGFDGRRGYLGEATDETSLSSPDLWQIAVRLQQSQKPC